MADNSFFLSDSCWFKYSVIVICFIFYKYFCFCFHYATFMSLFASCRYISQIISSLQNIKYALIMILLGVFGYLKVNLVLLLLFKFLFHRFAVKYLSYKNEELLPYFSIGIYHRIFVCI